MRWAPLGLLALLVLGCGEAPAEPHAPEAHGDEPPAGLVRLSPTAMERAGIEFAEVEGTALTDAVRIPAEVQLDPDRVVHVASLVAGQIAEVRVSLGERVETGDVLAVVRSVDLGQVRASLSEARAELEVAQQAAARHEALVDAGIGARRNLVEARGALQSARARVAGLRDRVRVYGRGGSGATMPLRSSIDGEIVERHATIGEVVSADDTLFVVADTSVVWVVGRAYAQDIESLSEGLPATFTHAGRIGQPHTGTLDWVAPVLDESTRSLPVRMGVLNEDRALRPGLFGTLRVSRPGGEPTPTVRADAVQQVEGQSVVFSPTDTAGELRVRPITVGRTVDGRTEVIDGIEVGERYVAENAFVAKSQLMRSQLEGHEH